MTLCSASALLQQLHGLLRRGSSLITARNRVYMVGREMRAGVKRFNANSNTREGRGVTEYDEVAD